jgi:preprotein translocase subunit SecE
MAKTVAVAEQTPNGMQSLKNQPERLREFLKEVRSEMRKVWWPGWPEVQSTTIVVVITVFWLVDNIIGRAIEALLHALTAS